MIFWYDTQAGIRAECELFISSVGGKLALLFVQAPDAHPIKHEITSLVEQAMDRFFGNMRGSQIDVRIFEHYPSQHCHNHVCTEVELKIRRRNVIERSLRREKVWKACNPTRREITHSSSVYISLMWIMSAHVEA